MLRSSQRARGEIDGCTTKKGHDLETMPFFIFEFLLLT